MALYWVTMRQHFSDYEKTVRYTAIVANSGSLADYTIKHCTMLHFNTNLLFIS